MRLFDTGEMRKFPDYDWNEIIKNRLNLSLTDEIETKQFSIYEFGKCGPTNIESSFTHSEWPFKEIPPTMLEVYHSLPGGQLKPTILSQQWEEIIKEPIIPFDPSERKKRLGHAYSFLEPYIKAYQAMK